MNSVNNNNNFFESTVDHPIPNQTHTIVTICPRQKVNFIDSELFDWLHMATIQIRVGAFPNSDEACEYIEKYLINNKHEKKFYHNPSRIGHWEFIIDEESGNFSDFNLGFKEMKTHNRGGAAWNGFISSQSEGQQLLKEEKDELITSKAWDQLEKKREALYKDEEVHTTKDEGIIQPMSETMFISSVSVPSGKYAVVSFCSRQNVLIKFHSDTKCPNMSLYKIRGFFQNELDAADIVIQLQEQEDQYYHCVLPVETVLAITDEDRNLGFGLQVSTEMSITDQIRSNWLRSHIHSQRQINDEKEGNERTAKRWKILNSRKYKNTKRTDNDKEQNISRSDNDKEHMLNYGDSDGDRRRVRKTPSFQVDDDGNERLSNRPRKSRPIKEGKEISTTKITPKPYNQRSISMSEAKSKFRSIIDRELQKK